MKNKLIIVSILLIFTAGGAFAQMSVGGGGSFTKTFGGGYEAVIMDLSGGYEVPLTVGGVFAFLDMKYVEASVGLFFGKFDWIGNGMLTGQSLDIKISSFSLGALGKYPFQIGRRLKLFPAAGIEFNSAFSVEVNGDSYDNPRDFNHLWVKFGAGTDILLTQKLYLRGTVLYGIRFATKAEKDIIKYEKEMANYEGLNLKIDPVLGHGIQIKAALGYMY